MGNKGTRWTLQEFTSVAGKPWYALQEQSDSGVERQFTGNKQEMDALCRKHRIRPQELPQTTEEEFLNRAQGDMPQEPSKERRGR